MEENTFDKDKTPYLVFACKKCQQFSYVKTSQATKKCLRCGRSHRVKSILGEGEIVYGMTLAVNTVKRNQNQLTFPEFRSQGDFIINSNRINNKTNRFSGTSEKCDKEAERILKLFQKQGFYEQNGTRISINDIPLFDIDKYKKK